MHPLIPKKLSKFINNGLIKKPPTTRFPDFIQSTKLFIPGICKAKYVGSMFTVRVVLPKKDKTDERPTLVKRIDKRVITVFSGKISNCVDAAYQVGEIINSAL